VRGEQLKKELNIFTFLDLLEHFPYRHVDKTQVSRISDINPQTEFIQVTGVITDIELLGEKRGKRLVAHLEDGTGVLELAWFQGINWVQKSIAEGQRYLVYGRAGFFMGRPQITHPEIEAYTPALADGKNFLEPVYPTTEKLKARGPMFLKKIFLKSCPSLSSNILNLFPAILRMQIFISPHRQKCTSRRLRGSSLKNCLSRSCAWHSSAAAATVFQKALYLIRWAIISTHFIIITCLFSLPTRKKE
jgi:RecG-like helicase